MANHKPKHEQQIDDFVPMSRVRKFVEKNEMLTDETHITFEFMMSAFFPTIYQSVMKYGNDCYTRGYLDGLKKGKKKHGK